MTKYFHRKYPQEFHVTKAIELQGDNEQTIISKTTILAINYLARPFRYLINRERMIERQQWRKTVSNYPVE